MLFDPQQTKVKKFIKKSKVCLYKSGNKEANELVTRTYGRTH